MLGLFRLKANHHVQGSSQRGKEGGAPPLLRQNLVRKPQICFDLKTIPHPRPHITNKASVGTSLRLLETTYYMRFLCSSLLSLKWEPKNIENCSGIQQTKYHSNTKTNKICKNRVGVPPRPRVSHIWIKINTLQMPQQNE